MGGTTSKAQRGGRSDKTPFPEKFRPVPPLTAEQMNEKTFSLPRWIGLATAFHRLPRPGCPRASPADHNLAAVWNWVHRSERPRQASRFHQRLVYAGPRGYKGRVAECSSAASGTASGLCQIFDAGEFPLNSAPSPDKKKPTYETTSLKGSRTARR